MRWARNAAVEGKRCPQYLGDPWHSPSTERKQREKSVSLWEREGSRGRPPGRGRTEQVTLRHMMRAVWRMNGEVFFFSSSALSLQVPEGP